jgi:hypothetical protein
MRNKLPRNLKYSFLDELDIKPSVKFKLSRSLDRVVAGSENVIEHPMVKRLGTDVILSKWDKIFNENIDKFTDDFVNLEKANRSKIGPRSRSIPWSERKHSVDLSFSPEQKTRLSSSVLFEVDSLPPRLRPISVTAALKCLKNSTSSGLPFLDKKGLVKDQLINNLEYYKRRFDPCVLITRTQELWKTRDVWSYPILDVLLEMRYFNPFLALERTFPWRAALFGPETVDNKINELIDYAIKNNLDIMALDFPTYDATVRRKLQKPAFKYISSAFQMLYRQALEAIGYRFATIPLVTPDGVRTGEHGVPSGSAFTNTVDSAVQHLISKHYGADDNYKQIQGDDGVYAVKHPESLFSHFSAFGLDANREKCFISKDSTIYLQNYYSTKMKIDGQCRGIYPSYRALGRILFQERFTDYEQVGISGLEYNSLRVISILENCKYHPLFVQLVKFIAKLDKYGLGYTESGILKYYNYLKETSGIQGMFNYRRGDDIKGIYNFSTIRVLSQL